MNETFRFRENGGTPRQAGAQAYAEYGQRFEPELSRSGRICKAVIVLLLAIALVTGCNESDTSRSVVVYTSVDQPHAEPILKRFQQQTGIRVLPVYDVEAAKTTGLVNRLIAEKGHPQADVFWNGEFAQTLLLKQQGVLAPYPAPDSTIPSAYRDPQGYWTGFGGRARVLLVNAEAVPPSEQPGSIFDLLEDRWPANRIGIAYPLFGTTATQAAALYAVLGDERGKDYFQKLKDRGVRVLDGNASVRDAVVKGRLDMGLTDTDDACAALAKGAPVRLVLLDQHPEGLGTLVIPNTIALIAGGLHPDEARVLMDYLLSDVVESALITSGWIQVSLRGLGLPSDCPSADSIKTMAVDLEAVYQSLLRAKRELGEIFVR